MKKMSSKKQTGFTIVELLVVLTIIAILAVIGIPAARSMIVSGKVEPTASDINKVVAKIRANFTGQGAAPYAAIDTAVFSNTARNMASSMNVLGNGAAATTTHEIGATGAPLLAAPATITVANDSFTVTLNTVNDAACGIGAQLARAAEVITLNAVVVKANNAAPYNGAASQNACTADDTNTFVFTFR